MVFFVPGVLKWACVIMVTHNLGGEVLFLDTQYIMGMWAHPEKGHAIVLLEGAHIVALKETVDEVVDKLQILPLVCHSGVDPKDPGKTLKDLKEFEE